MFALTERLWDITEEMVAEGELEPVERPTRGCVAAQTRFPTVEEAASVHVQSLGNLTTAQAVTAEALRKEAVALDLARKARSGAAKIPSVAALREITYLLEDLRQGGGDACDELRDALLAGSGLPQGWQPGNPTGRAGADDGR